MKKIKRLLRSTFFPPDDVPRWQKVLPYGILGLLTLVVLVSSTYAWEYTNSPEFCGTVCHTMPPEYTSYLTSPHARIDCVDCHIGKGFIATRITRKAGDAKHIISLLFKDYEYPITAGELRPARETCERCHFPEKFSDDSLREIKSYGSDLNNTPITTYLVMKTGGGTKRMGLGQGIHWHVENTVNYLAADPREQEIPYVQAIYENGSVGEYVDVDAEIDVDAINPEDLKEMDCITCHNRITHLVEPPEKILDTLIARGIVSDKIPEIKRVAVEVLSRDYDTTSSAIANIDVIGKYYQANYPEFYKGGFQIIDDALLALKDVYTNSVYPELESDWTSHPNNVGHQFSPGCFRCHDGKHLNASQEAIRLECNVCHSIPVVASINDFVTDIEISRGPEPQSHLNPNWITLHREIFDQTCQNCHSIDDPGGISNQSFCSNSACHGSVFDYAGFDAPRLRAILASQIPDPADVQEIGDTPMEDEIEKEVDNETQEDEMGTQDVVPVSVPEETQPTIEGPITYENGISQLFNDRCVECHKPGGLGGLDLSIYEGAMDGSLTGPVIIKNDAAGSLLIWVQTGEQPHFGRFTQDEINLVVTWIDEGAVEK